MSFVFVHAVLEGEFIKRWRDARSLAGGLWRARRSLCASACRSADVVGWNGGTTPATLQGTTISIDVVDSAVVLNRDTQFSAQVIGVDVFATNGVIHVIDGVLTPPLAAHAG